MTKTVSKKNKGQTSETPLSDFLHPTLEKVLLGIVALPFAVIISYLPSQILYGDLWQLFICSADLCSFIQYTIYHIFEICTVVTAYLAGCLIIHSRRQLPETYKKSKKHGFFLKLMFIIELIGISRLL